MRYEVRNLRELVEFVDEMDAGDRLSFHTDKGVVAVRVNQNDVWLHEPLQAEPDWWVPSSKYLEPPYVEGWHDVTAFGDTKRVYVRANDGWRLDE